MLYIAYGSNLNKGQMAVRCPKAKPLTGFTLTNARLTFRGVADVEFTEGVDCPAGLWRITRKCERALDIYEGVKSGLYLKQWLMLSLRDPKTKEWKQEEALIYVMNASYYSLPSVGYFNTIRRGYHDFRLPLAKLTEALDHVKHQEWLP